jgi:hypothetical protein
MTEALETKGLRGGTTMGTQRCEELYDVEGALGRDLNDREIDFLRQRVDAEVDRRVLTGEQLSLFSMVQLTG